MTSHEQYKVDTTRFLLWLVNTARSLNHDIPEPIDLLKQFEKEQERLKQAKERQPGDLDLERDMAWMNVTSTESSTEAATPKRYPVTTEQILELADFIGKQEMTVTMPPLVWRSFNRAVRLRKQYGEKYAEEELIAEWTANAPPAAAQGDVARVEETQGGDGHGYFLTVLMQCAKSLRDRVNVQTLAQKQVSLENPKPDDTGDVNFYQLLLSVKDQDDFVPVVGKEDKLPIDDATSKRVFFEQKVDHQKELDFRTFCHLRDAAEIVQYVVDAFETGDQYTAVFLAEAAIELLKPIFEDLGQYALKHNLRYGPFSPKPDEFFYETNATLEAIRMEREKDKRPYLLSVPRIEDCQPPLDPSWKENHEYLVHYSLELDLECRMRSNWGPGGSIMQSVNEPLLATSLDELSRAYCQLKNEASFNIVTVIAADILRRIRLTDQRDQVELFMSLFKIAKSKDAQFRNFVENEGKYPTNAKVTTEQARTLEQWMMNWQFEENRYIYMRKVLGGSKFSGLHHDYPVSGLSGKELLKNLAHQKVADPPTDRVALDRLRAEIVLPPKDGKFLRKVNPALVNKVALCFWVCFEESGMCFANASSQIYSIAHLYNALKQLDRLDREWPEMEQIIEWYTKGFFQNEVPVNPEQFRTRFLLAAGFSANVVAAKKAPKKKSDLPAQFKKMSPTHKTLEMKHLPMTELLQNYIHGRDDMTLLRVLHHMDTEMRKSSAKSQSTSIISDRGILGFLIELAKPEHIPATMERMQFDYIALTRTCNELCHQMDLQFGSQVMLGAVPGKEHWDKPTHRGFGLVMGVIDDVDDIAISMQAANTKKSTKKPSAPKTTTDIIDATNQVLNNFLNSLPA